MASRSQHASHNRSSVKRTNPNGSAARAIPAPAAEQGRSAIERVRLARHPSRPQTLDYIDALCKEFFEIHGDRNFADDGAIIAGFAYFDAMPMAIVGQQRGRSTAERL